MNTSITETTTNAIQLRPAHLIQLAQPRLNKCSHVSEYLEQLRNSDYDLIWAEITETVNLDSSAWNELMNGGLLHDREWLKGKGGFGSWSFPEGDFFKLSKSDRELYRQTAFSYFIAVQAPTGTVVYIDPEGYSYARYLAFSTIGIPPEKSREQLMREKEAKERSSTKKSSHNWTRDEAIAEIRSALKRRSGRAWSVRGNRGTAWGWIDIGLCPKDYKVSEEHSAKLLGELESLLGTRSFSIPASNDYYQEYVDRANGKTPSINGSPYWD